VWTCGGITDNTTGNSSGTWAAVQPTQGGNPVPFTGDFAEFIVERKCANNTFPCTSWSPLTNFGQIWINGQAEDSNQNIHELSTDFYLSNQIQNSSSQTLASCQDSDGVSTEVITFDQMQ